jgi:hypothetical protein
MSNHYPKVPIYEPEIVQIPSAFVDKETIQESSRRFHCFGLPAIEGEKKRKKDNTKD